MRFSLLVICLCLFVADALAQESDYDKSVRYYRENKLDSAKYVIDRAVINYQRQHQSDSLVFAYTQKVLIEWEINGLEKAIEMMDTVIRLAARLAPKSIARVAAYSRMGQLFVQQFEFKKAASSFKIAEAAVDKWLPANKHYVMLYNQIAVMNVMAERYPAAKEYAELSYHLNTQLEGKDGAAMTGIVQTLFFASHYSDDLQAALKYGLEFQRLVKLHYPPGHPIFGVMHNSLAIVYETLLRYDEALYHRREAVDIQYKNFKNSKNSYSLASAYHNLGLLYGYLHEGYLAAEFLEKSNKLLAGTYGENGAGMVNILVDLAVSKQQTGDYEQAEKLFERAYALQKRHDPDNWSSLAYVESFFGDLYLEKKQYDKAAGLYQVSIANYRKAGSEDSKTALLTKESLAKTLSGTGQVEKALILQHLVLNKFRKIYPTGNDAIAGVLQGISETYLEAGNPGKALEYSNQVFAGLLKLKTLPESPRKWFAELPFSYHTSLYVRHRVRVLYTLFKKTGDSRFLKDLLLICDEYNGFISGNLHLFRTQATLSELAEVNKSIYSLAIESCWSLSSSGKDQNMLMRAFDYSERSKALLLKLVSNNMLVDAIGNGRDPIAQKDQAFRAQLNALNLQYIEAGHKDSLLSLLSATMEQYRLFQDSLKSAGNVMLLSKQNLAPYSLAVLRKQLLQKKQTLIEYAVTEESLFTFVVSTDTFRVRRTGREVLKDIPVLKNPDKLDMRKFTAPAYRLYSSLIKPLEPYFNSSRLLIVPDADLYYLNFESLVTREQETDFSDMPYLIRKYNISYLLSTASAIQFKHAQIAARNHKALLFAPVFTDKMKSNSLKGLKGPADDESTYKYLYRQPFALQAVLQIGRYISGDLFTEQKAGERTFKRVAPGYDILHLGTHAQVNDQAPLQSRLFFARALPEDTTDTEDGYLYAYEIYAMKLKAEMAVLTACQTGTGAYHQGEGVISLAHSFMYAGCPSVVMSLWNIDDKTSAGIITEFYRLLSTGKSKSEALRLSKLHYLDKASGAMAHPYYWAGLALIGDDTPVFAHPYRWLWLLPVAIILAALCCWIIRQQIRTGLIKHDHS